MKMRPFGAVLVAAASLALAGTPARADYVVKDGNGVIQTMKSILSGIIHVPAHVIMGLSGGTPTAANMTTPGALDFTCVAGCPGASDVRPASSNITVVDSGTATTTGQGSVSLVTGTPTANSFQTQAINAESSAAVTVTGTFVATLQIEASYNGGTTYAPVKGQLRGTDLLTSSITGPAIVSLDVTGATHLRVRATSYTSGTPTVQMAFSAAPGMTKILNGVKLVDSAGANVDLSAAGSGIGATGAARPANAVQIGVQVNGTLDTPIACDKSVIYDASTSGETQLVAASGSTVIYVCGYVMFTPGTVSVNLASADTGGACANPVKLTPAYQLTAQSGAVDGSPFFRGMKTPAGKALCWNASGAVAGQGVVYYAQF